MNKLITNNMNKPLFTLIFTFFMSVLTPINAAEVSKLDRIIVVVDQSVITENELDDRMRTVLNQLVKQENELPPEEVLKKQILERLIVDKLQLSYATQTGMKVDDGQLDKTIERIAEQNKLSVPDFKKALEADGIPYRKFREDIRSEITIARLREREVENRINITETDVDNHLTTKAAGGDALDEYELAHIMVRTPEDASPEDLQKLKEKAEKAFAEVAAGGDFKKASLTYSDAPNALEGGMLGWKNSEQIPRIFAEAVKPIQKGNLAPIFRSPNGFHILKVLDRRGGLSQTMINQTHVRHILIKLTEVTNEAEALRKLGNIKERLDNGADFVEMARTNSEDGSAPNGGDLGWVNPGETVPQFETVMNDLKLNEISAPVRSPFGFHVIQVLERRNQDVTNEAKRIKARQEIRARKADEAYQDWLRELRDRAFIEYRLVDKF